MKKIILLSFFAMSTMGVSVLNAQDQPRKKETEINKNDGDVKLEIKNGEIYIDGKKVTETEISKGKDGKVIQKRIIINGKELSEEEMEGFEASPGFLFNYDENDKKPMLGVSTKESNNNDGALVESVVPNSPAQKIGLQKGDIITRVNDRNIYAPKDLVEAIAAFKPGNEIEVTYERDHKFLTKNVVLKGRNDVSTFRGSMPFNEDIFRQFGDGENPFLMNPYKNNPYLNNPYLNDNPKIGVSVEDMSEGKGVNVLEVSENSAAQKAGIQKGDIISTFNSKDISNVDELLNAIADAKDKKNVPIEIIRSGVKRQITLTIPKNLKKRDL